MWYSLWWCKGESFTETYFCFVFPIGCFLRFTHIPSIESSVFFAWELFLKERSCAKEKWWIKKSVFFDVNFLHLDFRTEKNIISSMRCGYVGVCVYVLRLLLNRQNMEMQESAKKNPGKSILQSFFSRMLPLVISAKKRQLFSTSLGLKDHKMILFYTCRRLSNKPSHETEIWICHLNINILSSI